MRLICGPTCHAKPIDASAKIQGMIDQSASTPFIIDEDTTKLGRCFSFFFLHGTRLLHPRGEPAAVRADARISTRPPLTLSRRPLVPTLWARVPVGASTPLPEPLIEVGKLGIGRVEEFQEVGVREELRAVPEAKHCLCGNVAAEGAQPEKKKSAKKRQAG